jgi:hypothetical protein
MKLQFQWGDTGVPVVVSPRTRRPLHQASVVDFSLEEFMNNYSGHQEPLGQRHLPLRGNNIIFLCPAHLVQ